MKTQIKITLALFSLVLIASCSNKTEEASNKIVAVTDFDKVQSENEDLVILDVRTPEEFSEGHIKDAILINFMGDDFQNKIENLDKSKTYLLYCKAGGRQEKASIQMESMGFENILLLDGGMTSWLAEGKPTEQ